MHRRVAHARRRNVSLDGRSYRSLPQNEIAKAVGFVPQSIAVSFDYSVVDYVVTGCAPRMGVFQRPKSSEYDVAWQAIRTWDWSTSPTSLS